MNYQIDLKAITTAISQPPFSKTWSIIQLHDEIPSNQLLDTIFEVARFIDDANKTSIFNQDRPMEERIFRLCDFLRMLKCKEALDNFDAFVTDVSQMLRESLLSCLTFLLKDLVLHKKRAYLALFLSLPEIPTEFSQDEGITKLM